MFASHGAHTLLTIGCILMTPIMYRLFKIMDSINHQNVQETPDEYMLYDRIGDLENDNTKLKKDIIGLKESYNKLISGMNELSKDSSEKNENSFTIVDN